MLKQICLVFGACTVLPLLNACVTSDVSSSESAKGRLEPSFQFIQLADGWHSFDFPSDLQAGYEPAHHLTLVGKLTTQSAGRLELRPHTEFQRHTFDSRVDSFLMAELFRPWVNGCFQDQLALSETWSRVSPGHSARETGRVPVDSPAVSCYRRSSLDPVWDMGQEAGSDVRQYTGILRDGRFLYMVCNEGDDPHGLAKCEVETVWRSARLTISFAARRASEWKSVIDLVDEKINAAHVAVHPVGSLGSNDLDVKLAFNDVTFQFPAELVNDVEKRSLRAGAEDWWVTLEASLSNSGEEMTPGKGPHETGYEHLKLVRQNVTISVNVPLDTESYNPDISLVELEGLTDWSIVSGDFKDGG